MIFKICSASLGECTRMYDLGYIKSSSLNVKNKMFLLDINF